MSKHQTKSQRRASKAKHHAAIIRQWTQQLWHDWFRPVAMVMALKHTTEHEGKVETP